MKKIISLLLVLLLALTSAMAVNAEGIKDIFGGERAPHGDASGSCGSGVTYSYVESTHTLTISGNGAMTSRPWSSYVSSIETVVINAGVTSIVNYAFMSDDGSSLTAVTIPSSVTTIGQCAFCRCAQLTSVTIPNGVTTIGKQAFSNTGITSITIPSGVTSIGSSAFAGCGSLVSATIYNGITTVSSGMFENCRNLSSVSLPNSVTTIDEYAFQTCQSLTSISIPSSVTRINQYAFAYCRSLSSITIPNSVTTIGQYAFNYCAGLTSATISSSVTSIGNSAFMDCSSLATLTLETPSSTLAISENAFKNCTSLTSVTIPNGVTSIGRDAFCNCSGLASVTILDSSVNIYNSYSTIPLNSSNKVMYGYSGSTAQTFAENYGYNFVPLTAGFTIDFDANGGSGAPNSMTKEAGTAITLPNTVPTLSGGTFLGWSLSPYADTPTYYPGDTYTREGDETLYAIWQIDYVAPAHGLAATLYDGYGENPFMTTKLPDMSMNIDTDGKPVGLNTANNNSISSSWNSNLKSIWSNSYHYDDANNIFLQFDPITGYYVFDSAKQTATYSSQTHEFTVNNNGGGQFLPVNGAYYFGIQLSGNFVMPKNGQVQWRGSTSDMKYEFNGDDLIYVYIDGVKVLNGGSSYGAVKTYINFATGEVATVPEGRSDGQREVTTLRAQYTKAYQEAHGAGNGAHGDGLSDYLNSYFELKNGNYVLKENTVHTFEMFYAETGAIDSNCKVRLNLVLEPQDNNTTYKLTYNSGNKTFTNATLNPHAAPRGTGEVTSKLHDDTYAYGATDTVAGNSGIYEMDLNGSTFRGWGLEANSTQVDYAPNDTIHIYQDTTLYAKFSDTQEIVPSGYIYYWDGDVLLQTEELNDRVGENYTIAENPITDLDAYADAELDDRLLPIKGGYVWGGWYKINQAPGTTNGAQAFPKTFEITNGLLDANGNLNLYAGWVEIGTVSVNSQDPNKDSYGSSSLSGFNLEGIQIKSKDIDDNGVEKAAWQNAPYDGLRFITVYSNTLLNNLDGLIASGNPNQSAQTDISTTYGYTMYAKTDIANLTTLKANTSGAVDVPCTRDGDMNHKYFTAYRLSTVVVKYEGADQTAANLNALIEARAYADYMDANGFARREYNTYIRPNTSKFAGGCRASFQQAHDALTRVQ
ncbi:MAG: leucine-rich repeat protein [Clostridiales bacterium]|nr:leucine-rich repeat protein [Clostridiales bacterium]